MTTQENFNDIELETENIMTAYKNLPKRDPRRKEISR